VTEAYCKRQGLKLIEDYFDLGVSGFNGANLSDGNALRALLDAAKEGKFRPGTHLIVESLDRLSRSDMSVAVRLFLDLLDAGLVIVTLIDGEQEFTKERVDNDTSAIVIVILLLMRANQESRIRRERMLQSHKARRVKARKLKLPLTKRCPSWLLVKGNGDQRHFMINPRRAEIVVNIFQLCLSGLGEHRTVAYLNQRGVRNFNGTTPWRGSMIQKLLRNPAVYGLYRPCYKAFVDGRMQRVPDPEGPIEAYYPPILSKELFDRVQRARAGRTTTRLGKRALPKRNNLFTGLGHCAVCGSGLYLTQAVNGYSYLKCVKGYDWACSNRLGFPYRKLEAVFLALDDLMGLAHDLIRRTSDGDPDALSDGQLGLEGESGRDRVFSRFRTARALLESPQLPDAMEARLRLLNEVRRLCEGVVLHKNRLVTLHVKDDAAKGSQITLIVNRDGLRGIQITTGTGKIGFITAGVAAGFVRPTTSGIGKAGADNLTWRPSLLKNVLERVRIVLSPNGDWEAAMHDPTQLAEIVAHADMMLRSQ